MASNSNNSSNKVAVVLSGGGALAAFETGVLSSLIEGKSPATGGAPLRPDAYTGTSAGSFNAAMMAMYAKAEGPAAIKNLADAWLNRIAERPGKANGVFRIRGNPLQYFDLAAMAANPVRPLVETARDAAHLATQWMRRTVESVTGPGSLPNRAMRMFDLSEFFCVDAFRQTLEASLTPSRIRSSGLQLRIAATNWKTGAKRMFTEADMTDQEGRHIVLASSAIPGVFPPARIGPDEYVDGGLVQNTPLSGALEVGAEELHVVYLFPPVSDIPLQQIQDTVETFNRVYTILLATKLEEDIETACWVNEGLTVMEKAEAGSPLDGKDAEHFTRVAGQIAAHQGPVKRYRKLTIHRYFPGTDLGGALGVLNFERRTIERLIELGYKNGREHDCARNGCLLKEQSGQPEPPPPLSAPKVKASGAS